MKPSLSNNARSLTRVTLSGCASLLSLLSVGSGCDVPDPCSATGDSALLGIVAPSLPSAYTLPAAVADAECTQVIKIAGGDTAGLVAAVAGPTLPGACLVLDDGDFASIPA